MRPVSPRFIACRRSLADARIVLYGIPFEGRVNLRKGADGGPRDLRLASDSIETYSPFLDRDMEDLPLADIGERQVLHVAVGERSEEHTSELQSRPHIVCRLLLEKKN